MLRPFAQFLLGSRRSAHQSGVAAIEFALIVPVMLVLFLGMLDLTAVVSTSRNVSYAASSVADLISQQTSTTTAAAVDDSIMSIDLLLRPRPTSVSDVRVDVYAYRMVNGSVQLIWNRSNGRQLACTVPSQSGMASLMTAGNDLIVAVVCARYETSLSKLFGKDLLGSSTMLMREQIALRPRQSDKLDCPDCSSVPGML